MAGGTLKRVYNSRGARRGAAAVKLQRFIRRRRSARAQSVQLAKTNTRIDLIRSKLRKEVNRHGLYNEQSSVALGGYTCFMIQPASTAGINSPAWPNCFATSALADEATRARLGRVYVQMQLTCFTEPQPITFSIFHVRLNPKNSTYMIGTFGTKLTGITAPRYFIRGGTAVLPYTANTEGHIQLNPDYFIVKRKWVFTLTNRQIGIGSSQTSTASSTYRNFEWDFPLNYTVGIGRNSWRLASADADTKADYKNYLLVFTNNSNLDAESCSISLLMQCTATALE